MVVTQPCFFSCKQHILFSAILLTFVGQHVLGQNATGTESENSSPLQNTTSQSRQDSSAPSETVGLLPGAGLQAISVETSTDIENRLKRKLLENHDATTRPAHNISSPVIVKIGMALNQIVRLDEKHQSLTTHIWMRLSWTDVNFRWNPDDYGGLTSITLPPSEVWIPDIVVYNDGGDGFGDLSRFLVRFMSDGSTFWPFPSVLVSECDIVVTTFPFDRQSCIIKLGSWVYTGSDVDLKPMKDHGDTSFYNRNGQWMLCELPVKKSAVLYTDPVTGVKATYPDITFTLELKRRTMYYIVNVLLPSMSIILVGIFTFVLPVESGEKVSLVVTILLALTVFLLVIVDNLPNQSVTVPIIGVYLTVIIGLMGFSAALTVVVVHVYHRGTRGHRAPSFLRFLAFNCIAPFLCMGDLKKKRAETPPIPLKYISTKQSEIFQNMSPTDYVNNFKLADDKVFSETELKDSNETLQVLNEIKVTLQNASVLSDSQSANGIDCAGEWADLSLILDRIFMYVFVAVTIAMTIWFLAFNRDHGICEEIGLPDS